MKMVRKNGKTSQKSVSQSRRQGPVVHTGGGCRGGERGWGADKHVRQSNYQSVGTSPQIFGLARWFAQASVAARALKFSRDTEILSWKCQEKFLVMARLTLLSLSHLRGSLKLLSHPLDSASTAPPVVNMKEWREGLESPGGVVWFLVAFAFRFLMVLVAASVVMARTAVMMAWMAFERG